MAIFMGGQLRFRINNVGVQFICDDTAGSTVTVTASFVQLNATAVLLIFTCAWLKNPVG